MFVTAIVFFLVLSVLVFVHELGHFLVARWVGVRVDEFGFGIPPRVWGKKFGKTLYSINMLPIGGFVKLAGEDADSEEETKDRKKLSKQKLSQFFWARSMKERAAILLAGVTMNVFLAIGITAILLVNGIIEPVNRVHIEKVTAGAPAQIVGLKPGDVVESIKPSTEQTVYTMHSSDELVKTVKKFAGIPIELVILRDGMRNSYTVTPRMNPPAGQGALGVAVSNLERIHYPWYRIPDKSVSITAIRSWQMVSSIGNLAYRFFSGQQVKSGEISGPVGIAQVTGEAIKYGWEAVLELMSILSLNLAILNVLPFPALDGGRLLFVVLEKMGRKARPDIERTIHQIGMIVLLILIVLITVNDILRIARG